MVHKCINDVYLLLLPSLTIDMIFFRDFIIPFPILNASFKKIKYLTYKFSIESSREFNYPILSDTLNFVLKISSIKLFCYQLEKLILEQEWEYKCMCIFLLRTTQGADVFLLRFAMLKLQYFMDFWPKLGQQMYLIFPFSDLPIKL